MAVVEQIDWSQCPLIEAKPRVLGGAPVLRGTRMPVSAIVDNSAYGLSVAEIVEQFQIPEAQVQAILTYAKSHRVAHSVYKNVPFGVLRFLAGHQVQTVVELDWPQMENGELLKAAEEAAYDVLVTCDQNIELQQNLTGRKLALVVLGSNIWPIVRNYEGAISNSVQAASPGSYEFIEMPPPPKGRSRKT